MFSNVSDIVIVSQGGLLYKEGRPVWNLVKLVNIVKLESLVIVAKNCDSSDPECLS